MSTAIKEKHGEIIKLLLNCELININQVDSSGNSSLILAAATGQTKVVEWIIKGRRFK
ncbi:ankyrin repeat domain-containing protein [Sodalis ligni]|nr:ankyrin repeat domain-containing protein [Sodalis ligni]